MYICIYRDNYIYIYIYTNILSTFYHYLPTFSIFLADVPRSAGDLIEKAQQKAEAIQAAIKAREEEEKRKKEAERLRTAVGWTD